jgi:ATP-dependent DNA ligase
MLASAITDPRSSLTSYDTKAWVIEEKFDGLRLVVDVSPFDVTAFSRPRGGKAPLIRPLPPHISAACAGLPFGVNDGELACPGGKAWDVLRLTNADRLVLVLFDVLRVEDRGDITAWGYAARHALLTETVRAAGLGAAIVVSASVAGGARQFQVFAESVWQRGGEGVMLKRAASRYQPGRRSPDWLKVKRQRAETLAIVGFEAGKLGPHAIVRLQDGAGTETTVKALDDVTRAAIDRDPAAWIGRRLVISFQEKTPDGKWRHPMWDHLAGEGE